MENAATKLVVSSSPHIKDGMSTRRMMAEVMLALVPALAVGVAMFGLYSLLIVLVTIGSAVLGEFLFNLATKRKQSIGDLSACVTGLILGLNLPPAVPIYVPLIGGAFATVVVKMLFGGIGKNFANPAATARIFLLLAWPLQMVTWIAPLTYTGQNIFYELTKTFAGIGSSSGINSMTGATPLSSNGEMNILHMFLGNIGGCIGETSALALILGGVYLAVRRIIDWKIPAIYLGSFALFTLIFTGTYTSILPQLCGGGLMLGAFFMATDYSTSPDTTNGTIIYALALGFLTVLLRQFTNMSEGVSYAIVLVNLIVPLLDKYILPRFFGSAKKPILSYVLVGILALGLLGGSVGAGVSYGIEMGRVKEFYTASASFTDRLYQNKSETADVRAVYRAGDGALIFHVTGKKGWKPEENAAEGYVRLLVAVKDGKIAAISVVDHNQTPWNSPAEGAERVLTQEYLNQFVGKTVAGLNEGFTPGGSVDTVTGATMTSNAIVNAVNRVVYTYNRVFAEVTA